MTYARFYNPSVTDKDIVLFKGRDIFRQYAPKKNNYKLCNMIGYTHNMIFFLGKDDKMQCALTSTVGKWKGLAINFMCTICYHWIHLKSCTQEL